MENENFIRILNVITVSQRNVLISLASEHPDIFWKGNSLQANPLRISLFLGNRSISAINTRKRNAILRLEFRSRDYDGPDSIPTRHHSFDRKFDIMDHSDLATASNIISKIKLNYDG